MQVNQLHTDVYNLDMDALQPVSKRSAGRPRAFDRDAALAIAMDMFWRQGYEGTSTTQLIAAMGISQPSLYAAFGSKVELYREALTLYVNRYGTVLLKRLDMPNTSAREAMAKLLMNASKQYASGDHAPGCMVACSALQGDPSNGEIQAHVASLRAASEATIRMRLDQAQADGELAAKVDTRLLAGYFAMVIQGLAVQAHDGASYNSLKRMAEMAMSAWPNEC